MKIRSIGLCPMVALMAVVALAACGTVSRGTDMVTGVIGKPLFGHADPDNRRTVRRQPAQPVLGPEQLIGLTDGQVQSNFGSPSFIRHEAPAAVWQYRRANCIIDFFMYSDGPTSGYRVEHVELRPLEAGGVLSVEQRQHCARDLGGVG